MSIRRKLVGTIVVAAALLVPVAQADDWASDGIAASEVADSTHPTAAGPRGARPGRDRRAASCLYAGSP